MSGLKGKVVMITGAARRIGRHLAMAAARAGAEVAITYLNSQHDAERSLAEIRAEGGKCIAVRCDVRDEQSVQAAVREVVHRYGGIDVLVNNSGAYEMAELESITVEQWDRMFAVNARGPFLVAKAAAPALRRRRGRIINIGSLGGVRPWAENAHYCASKAAVVMLTETMAKALAPKIAVNCVAPGMIRMGESAESKYYKSIARRTPMKRAGTPADVAEAVLFFATATHFITGQTLLVDGGLGLG